MNVDELDIPGKAIDIIKSKGIEELYPPQAEGVDDVLNGDNCVFALPTASGKSLLSYLAIIKKVVEENGKGLYIVPLRALASEKVEDLKEFEELGLDVGVSMGNYDQPDPTLKEHDIIVATSEKADSLLRHNVEWLKQINVVVSDEVHLINDKSRGATLEVTLSKLKQVNPEAQLVALSATISNSDIIADWLDAKHHKSEWRPVELKKGVYFDNKIRYSNNDTERVKGSKPVPALSRPTLSDGNQCLVFVKSRRSTEAVAREMARVVPDYLTQKEKKRLNEVADEIEQESKTSLGSKLASYVKDGAAFHNAGLNNKQRSIVERAFRDRLIKVISATPTLAAGINMPARRVIVRDCKRYDPSLGYNALIPVMEVQQMLGRAGRPGYDDQGEAILVAKKEEDVDEYMDNYILGDSEVIFSKMAMEPALRKHLLALIATSHCKTEDSIYEFMNETFYSESSDIWMIESRVKDMLELLMDEELIKKEGEQLKPTFFGKRVSDLYIDPLSAIKMRDSIQSNKKGSELAYLHMISSTENMYTLFTKKKERTSYEERIKNLDEDLFWDIPEERGEREEYFRAFKTALMLKDWIDEVHDKEIAEKYGIGPGDIYGKVETTEWLVNAAAELSKIFNKDETEKLENLTTRIKYGIKKELFPLMTLEQIGRVRARILYDNEYKTPEKVERTSVDELAELEGIGRKVASKAKGVEYDQSDMNISIMSASSAKDSGQTSLQDY